MDILIKNMEMPQSCSGCPLGVHEEGSYYYECKATEGITLDWKNKPNYCPLVEVPTHGRLIDADALLKTIKEVPITDEPIKGIVKKMMCDFATQILDKSVTVIEAST